MVFIGEERERGTFCSSEKEYGLIYGAFLGYVLKQYENNGPHVQKICDVKIIC